MPSAGREPRSRRAGRQWIRSLAFGLVGLLWLSGCTGIQRALGYADQVGRANQLARVSGRIDTEGPAEGPLVVVIARAPEVEGGALVGVDSFVRVRPGSYAFGVTPGRYQLGAYEDRNANGLLDPGERTLDVREGRVIEVGLGGSATENLLLRIDATSPPELTEPMNVLDLVARTPRAQGEFSLWAWSVQGEICDDLSDPKFGAKSGPRGLWEVMDFLNEGLAGIYFLEPFDPDRIPVLFVHGIGGFPQQFEAMIDGLDRERFQPWFYFYPSGFALDGLASHLSILLERLQVQLGFDELAVIAHSMGGLVARGAILKYAAETDRDDVGLFVTISTPWGGDVSAERAASAPIALPPSFEDMSPKSDYLRWLYYEHEELRSLPPSAEFHLVFGYRMDGSSQVANDGSVSVASQARLEAQAQATTIRALDYGHVAILASPEALAHVNQLLGTRFR
jgi:pimeloyl-ACP methyl ester carboxylesterase